LETTNHTNPDGPPRRRRTTRGKGRKINYWEDKAIDPPEPCTVCGGETIYQFRRFRCVDCGQEF
jgi:hypothetical protein